MTLVNLIGECWCSGVSTSNITDKSNVTATSNVNKEWASINFRVKKSSYKQNTDYIAMWDDIVGDDVPYKLVKTYNDASVGLPISQTGLQHQVTNYGGKNFIVFNSGDCTTSLNIRIHLTNETTSETQYTLAVKNMKVMEYQEGMENWDIPYFEGMKSVQMPVLKTTGKNLFKASNNGATSGLTFTVSSNNYLVNGTCIKDDADFYVISPSNNVDVYQRLNSLPIGTKISVSKNSGIGRQIFLSITQKDGSSTKYVQTHTTTENDKAMQCFVRFMNGDTFDNTEMNIQLEINSKSASYEPYQSSTISISDYVLNNTQFEQGTFSESSPTGTPYRQTLPTGYMDIRLRSKSLFKVSGNTIRGTLNEGYGIFFGFFKDGKYLSKYSIWMDSTNFSVDVPYECNEFCIVLRKNISDTY